MRGTIRVAIFDAYGTLFDVHAAAKALAPQIGPEAERLSNIWRQKQLEYTWLRSLMRSHADFWQVTGDALDYAMAAVGLEDDALRTKLLDLYRHIDPYPEVKGVLTRLRKAGITTAILSNGEPGMLQAAVEHAGLTDHLDEVLSVEPMQVFKPSPVVYRIPGVRFGLRESAIAFMTANGWDAAGAANAGLRAVWINRAGMPQERLPATPEVVLEDLRGLPNVLV